MDIYSVKSGDNLWLIANRYKVTPQAIINANGLDRPDYLVVGMNLLIPTPSPSSAYVVKRGDTPFAISQRYGLTVSQLIAANSLVYPYTIYPGQVLSTKALLETIGYFIPSRVPNKALFINSLAPYLTYLALFDFPVTAAGQITGIPDADTIAAARNNRLPVLPVLTNLRYGEFSSEIGHMLVLNAANRTNLVNNILTFLQINNFRGVVIDFENLPPADRNLFTLLIQELYTRLHNAGKILVLNIAPKWEDWYDREWVGFFDYSRLGPVIDIAAMMTYEWGWRSGPPRPTAPLPYIRRVFDYTLRNGIPAGKISMGLTLFGYDWLSPYVPGTLAATVTLPGVWQLARTYTNNILFDNTAKQPNLKYYDSSRRLREVWFEDALSHYYKYRLVNEYGLRGTFYWLVDQPFPATWYMASNLFTIRKT